MQERQPDTDQLLQLVRGGDAAARDRLLARHRTRLRRMVHLHLDPRLATRVDPSDVVQETLAEAARRLGEYLRDAPMPFYPWLRQLAWQRLAKLRRRHIQAQKRSVRREDPADVPLSDESVLTLAGRLVLPGTTPSHRLLHEEQVARVQAALGRLGRNDREVIVLRHLEQLTVAEIAAVLGISEGAVKVRHLRALQRLRDLLTDDPEA